MAPALTHPMFVASGVTAVRDMGGCLGPTDSWAACAPVKRAWNSAVIDGSLVGPRFDQITSLAVNGGSAVPDGYDVALGAGSPEGAKARVAHDKARGIDFLKTYSQLPRDGYLALAAEAEKQGMYVAGHLPFTVSARDAVAVGQRSFEHAFLFVWDCYGGMDGLRAGGDMGAAFTNAARERMIAGHDAARCEDLHGKMVAAGTAFVPTHTTRKLDAFASDAAFRSDPRLRFIPAPLRTMWLEDADNMAARAGDGGAESYQAFYRFGLRQTGIAHRNGVQVMLGTDAPDSFVFPGLSVVDELTHLRDAGLSPLAALQAATSVPARFLGLEGQAGVIMPGARADILLLDDNPLLVITAVGRIDHVILAGTPYDRATLTAMQEMVASNASSWSMWPKFAWQIVRSPVMMKQFAD
jgi:hypothetical protein